jgi:uncharacterized protein YecE (DUF72 family)
MAAESRFYVGTASWSIPKPFAGGFPAEGSHLERYARVLTGVEINSSFYRPHQPKTYARWAASVPDAFRFAVKAPQEITHKRRLKDSEAVLEDFLDQASQLGPKLGPLLFQLPPSLAYDPAIAATFFAMLRAHHGGPVVLEPRHPTWFTPEVGALLTHHGVARVAADPARVPEAAEPGGAGGLVYYRWHGSPRMYYSDYGPEALDALAARMAAHPPGTEVWCIFDNTTVGAATGNALSLSERLSLQPPSPDPRWTQPCFLYGAMARARHDPCALPRLRGWAPILSICRLKACTMRRRSRATQAR